MKNSQPYAAGYSLPLAEGIIGYAHADGSVSIEQRDGPALDLPVEVVEHLEELLKLSANLRSAARRRRARASYSARWDDGEA